jgi:hypothetical protein
MYFSEYIFHRFKDPGLPLVHISKILEAGYHQKYLSKCEHKAPIQKNRECTEDEDCP